VPLLCTTEQSRVLSVCCRQLKLDIVWVAECQDIQTEIASKILDLAMGHIALFQSADREIEIFAAGHSKAWAIWLIHSGSPCSR